MELAVKIITDCDKYDQQRIIDAVNAVPCPICKVLEGENCSNWGGSAVHLARENKAYELEKHRLSKTHIYIKDY